MTDLATVDAVAATMRRTGLWWAVAGGWAIDLWLGAAIREHHDVEVVVRRDDQHAVHAALSDGWDLFALEPPGSGWQPWTGAPMAAPSFQLQARSPAATFDLFTEDIDHTRWTYRRDPRVSLDVAQVAVPGRDRIPVVRPSVQLLYMAKGRDPKNEIDFEASVPHLDAHDARWLSHALDLTLPGHPWARRLAHR